RFRRSSRFASWNTANAILRDRLTIFIQKKPLVVQVRAVFILVDHSRDALMQRPYKVLVMAM
ncbi:MAG: hypothetical protein O4860_07580, partial [Trichodesmium sp. St2_bin2_1]|nr:hypothetical protein [Trichodesmium sp. St2_bin2_1]